MYKKKLRRHSKSGEKGNKSKGKQKKNVCVKKKGEKPVCKNCSKEGHDEARCWELHPELRPKKFNNKGKQKTNVVVQQDLGSDLSDETKIAATVTKEEAVASTSTTNKSSNTSNEGNIIDLFHIRVISKHTKIDTLFDSGSHANLISTHLVKKLNRETMPHHKQYPLGWITKDANL